MFIIGVGMLLFIAHALMSSEDIKCRFYGPCAINTVALNTVPQHPLTDEGNFVMSFTPLVNGKNELEIHTVKSPKSKVSYLYVLNDVIKKILILTNRGPRIVPGGCIFA